jgi:hypothetical protein
MDEGAASSALVRFGVMGRVERFTLAPGSLEAPRRGQIVVIESSRGIELGEVLLPLEAPDSLPSSPGTAGRRLLRIADAEDLARSRSCERLRVERLARCLEILDRGDWPVELLDVESTLDPGAVVMNCFLPEGFDSSLLRAQFRVKCGFDVLLESASQSSSETPAMPASSPREPRCGDCDCGGGGCSPLPEAHPRTATAPERDADERGREGCGGDAHGGCSGCGLSTRGSSRANSLARPAS